MIDEAPKMNALPSFVDEMIQSITSPTHSLSPKSAEASQEIPIVESAHSLDLSSTVIQVPSLINPSTNISTSWLQQSLERKKKRMIQLEAPNLDVVADLMHKGTKVKKTKVDSRLAVNSTTGNLFAEIAQPVIEKDMNEANESDFSITKVDLGRATREGKEHNFQVSAAILIEQSRRDKEAKNQLKCQVQALSSCIRMMVGDSSPDPNSPMEITGDPKKMFNEEIIRDIGECQTYGKMVKTWVKSMKE